MPRLNFREFFFGGTKFCCCLPVRMGLISMSVLGMLVAGLLSVVLWYEISVTPSSLTAKERAAFVAFALVETFLFAGSILGFIGAVVRKQLFVQIYVWFIWIHFVINLAVAAFILFLIAKFTNAAAYKACMDTINNANAQDQCTGFLKVARNVYIGVSFLVLFIEIYGAIIATRYLNLLQGQKRTAKAIRKQAKRAASSSFQMQPNPSRRTLTESPSYKHHTKDFSKEFDPYEEVMPLTMAGSSGHGYDGLPAFDDPELGYGGGSWTHDAISTHEKAKLRELDQEMGIEELPYDSYEERDHKTSAGPHAPASPELPRYAFSTESATAVGSDERH